MDGCQRRVLFTSIATSTMKSVVTMAWWCLVMVHSVIEKKMDFSYFQLASHRSEILKLKEMGGFCSLPSESVHC